MWESKPLIMKNPVFLFLLITTLSTFAQETKIKHPVYIGLEAGFNSSPNFSENDKILHDLFGITFNYFYTESRSIKIKVKYMSVEKNATANYLDYGYYQDYDVSYKADFIVIPVLYKWQFGKVNVNGFVQGGIYAGGELDAEYVGYPMNYSENPIDFGLSLGAGLQFPLIKDKLFVNSEIEVYQGLFSRIPDSEQSQKTLFSESLTNLAYSIGLCYKF
jgi:hypothetical protein